MSNCDRSRARRRWAASAMAAALFAVSATAAASELPGPVRNVRQAAQELVDAARDRLAPLAEGERRGLIAVVMSVEGRAQWRADETVAWKEAALDDGLPPGSMIRTGRASRLFLRVGQNATMLVDRNTRVVLPEVVQEGGTYRTAVHLERGRADFKVDRVGLTNDFSVVTPSATLAVRGTGFAVMYGGFNGTQVAASRMNEMFAVELRYFLAAYTYYLSGAGRSSDRIRNPVLAALFRTFGPPRVVGALFENEDTPEELASQLGRTPVSDLRQVDVLVASSVRTLESEVLNQMPQIPDEPMHGVVLPEFDPGDFQFGSFSFFRDIAEFICNYFTDIVDNEWRQNLIDAGLGTSGFNSARNTIDGICQQAGGQFDDEDLVLIFSEVVRYCQQQHGDHPEHFVDCVLAFVDAFNTVYEGQQK